LHACCHNPTGVDLDEGQWEKLIDVIEARGLLPFVDMAYQGFGAGLDADAFAVRELARRGVPTLVANSFSKNFSLYGERVGGLSVVCEDAAAAERVLGQLAGAVRSNYSNPQTYGAKVVAAVLGTPALRKQWEEELAAMCRRIARMRQSIHDGLRDHVSGEALTRYVKQRGMFTYTGLTESQVDALREVHGVYILRSGRMCVAGLNDSNVGIVADAIGKVLKSGA
ncbi:aminotransferase class I/II-fold pyridoxal phosphate-dependent enzyme, partial [Burkholderia cenocepacia]